MLKLLCTHALSILQQPRQKYVEKYKILLEKQVSFLINVILIHFRELF